MSLSDGLRVALIGAGGIAQDQHLPGWNKVPWARLVAAADPSPQALAELAKVAPLDRLVSDYRELLDDRTIDVVDVCAPSALHAEIVIAALAAGKHVLCEKPMATSKADAAAILAAWRASGKKLMIAQHLRFDPRVTQLRAYLASHSPGDIYYTRGQWLRRRRLPARAGFTVRALSGGGALYDLGVHLLDLGWWLCGCPAPRSVSGATYSHLARRGDLGGEWGQWNSATIEVEDFATGLLRFANGSVMSLEVSWLAFQCEAEVTRLQLLGTQAGIVWPEGRISGENQGVPWDVELREPTGEKPHHEVIRQFATAVWGDQPVPIPPDQSANVIAMLDSLYASAATGREVAVEGFSL